MSANPYESPRDADQPLSPPDGDWMQWAVKFGLCLVGVGLYVSNPWRDLWFYEDVAA